MLYVEGEIYVLPQSTPQSLSESLIKKIPEDIKLEYLDCFRKIPGEMWRKVVKETILTNEEGGLDGLEYKVIQDRISEKTKEEKKK